ncbi:SLAP domain-containing protein [Companilactobacillus baiquanensis]|uniref:SLAP domain-containing protein n=1 Tax=Companilactobacillus baiquanensis TaxID=2486005 RepID=A0ABW1UVY6_9LACO|nr:SLAP domain-containing protein [Companilactobacillus baiquanensis]
MEENKVKFKVSDYINKNILMLAPALLLSGITIGVQQNTVKADVSPQVAASTDENTNDIATSAEYGKIGGENGSDWAIDAGGVLHIQAGTWDDSSVSEFWNNLKANDGSTVELQNEIKSVVFEGNVIAGASLEGLFSNAESLESVSFSDGVKFDTSNTTNFNQMFLNTALKSFDMNNLNWDNVTSSDDMFNNSQLSTVSMDGIKANKLKSAASMFLGCTNLVSASFNNTEFSMDELDIHNLLSNCIHLKEVDLTNAFTGNINNTSSLFDNDYSIENLDVSSMNLSDDTSVQNMFRFAQNDLANIKLQSITLPANANISGSSIDLYDSNRFQGWKTESSDDILTYLIEYYEKHDIGKTTWTLADRDKADYKVIYKDENGKIIKTVNGNGIVGDLIDITKIAGYYPVSMEPNDPTITSNPNQEFVITMKELKPYTIVVSVEYGDGHPGESFEISVPIGVTDPTKEIDHSILDKYSNNDTLNLQKSTVRISDILTGGPDDQAESMDFNAAKDQFSVVNTSLSSFFDGAINVIEKHPSSVGPGSLEKSGKTFNAFSVYYDKYVETATKPGGNNGGTATDRDITEINQKSATFGDKVTDLYDINGKMISDIKLAKNSDWKNDQKMVLDGVTYYRVSTNAWVKANDVYVYIDNFSKVRVNEDKDTRVIKATSELTDRALEKSTEWKTDRYTMINGEKYYRVSTEGFVKDGEVSEYFD